MTLRFQRIMAISLLVSVMAAASDVPLRFTVTNPAELPQHTIARVSVPLPQGTLAEAPDCGTVTDGQEVFAAQARPISRHPDGSVRRIMLSIPLELAAGHSQTLEFTRTSVDKPAPMLTASNPARLHTETFTLHVLNGMVQLLDANERVLVTVEPFGPNPGGKTSVAILDTGAHFVWLRYHEDGEEWSREVDIEVSRLGEVTLTHRIQAHPAGDHWTPDFGWILTAPDAKTTNVPAEPAHMLGRNPNSRFSDESNADLTAQLTLSDGTALSVANPLALRQNRGTFEVTGEANAIRLRSNRNEPVEDIESNGLMIQEGAWRFSKLVIAPATRDVLTARLDNPVYGHADWQLYDAVYGTGKPLEVKHAILQKSVEKIIYALRDMQMKGDDLGSMPWSWTPNQSHPDYTSSVRLNHSLYIWEEWFRGGDARLRTIAHDWLRNYYELGMYWGPNPEYYGACRRGNLWRDRPGHGPGTFNPRFANTPIYVHKGWSSFYLMFEETGDPRYREAAETAAEWSIKDQHAGLRYTRTIGVVTDAVKMFEYTGDQRHLNNAIRLWETFQEVQGEDLLFTESGKPAVGNELYIGEDDFGYRNPFVKPYIVQYATNALPYLLKHTPEDARLRDTIFALNDWMATHRQPGGGWGYPHYLTAGMGWNNEYCHGIILAAHLEPKQIYLDAIRENLAPVIQLLELYGELPRGLNPWEFAAGINAHDRQEKYELATDRETAPDYEKGQVKFSQSPDNCVYYPVLLRDYLDLASEESLLERHPVLEKIKQLPTTLDPSVRAPKTISMAPGGTAIVSLLVDIKTTETVPASMEITGLPDSVTAKPGTIEWMARQGHNPSPEIHLTGTVPEKAPITIRWQIGQGWQGAEQILLEPSAGSSTKDHDS